MAVTGIITTMQDNRLDATDIKRTLGRMAHQILEQNQGASDLVVIGVLNRGFPVAKRLAFAMTQIEGVTIPVGKLDIGKFRDDSPSISDDETEIPFSVQDKQVILVDEVIQTGRTVRAALDAIIHHGRPANIQLAVLVDRGGRELPIQPNYVGKQLDVSESERIEVHFAEVDGEDSVIVQSGV